MQDGREEQAGAVQDRVVMLTSSIYMLVVVSKFIFRRVRVGF